MSVFFQTSLYLANEKLNKERFVSAFVQIGYRATTLHAMSGIFVALLCAFCFAGLFLGVELWHFYRHTSKSSTYLRSRSLSKIATHRSSSKERYVKFSFIIPDNCQTPIVLKELELLYHDAGLRNLQQENSQQFYYDK